MPTVEISQPLPAHPAVVARQPICDREQRTFGYELLFRKPGSSSAQIDNPDQATDHVIFDSLLEIGLDRMAGRSAAFINVTGDFILSGRCRSLPREQVVLEILETVEPTTDLLRMVQVLSAEGYRFALDDYAFEERMQPLLPHCSFVKVDVRLAGRDSVTAHLDELKRFPGKLLAEKVETREEFDFYQKAGFDYFQGYFFCKPKNITRARIPRNGVSINLLLSRLQDPFVEIREVETIVSEDLALSYQLLRYINSASFSFPRQIESIGHAVRLVGIDRMKTLASLLMLRGVEDKPRELFVTSLVRARMCELMAQQNKYENPNAYFTAGLLASLDAFLDCRLDQALELLPLSSEIRSALLRHEGRIGQVLKLVRSYETGNWASLDSLKVDTVPMGTAYLKALDYGENLIEQLGGNGRQRRAN